MADANLSQLLQQLLDDGQTLLQQLQTEEPEIEIIDGLLGQRDQLIMQLAEQILEDASPEQCALFQQFRAIDQQCLALSQEKLVTLRSQMRSANQSKKAINAYSGR